MKLRFRSLLSLAGGITLAVVLAEVGLRRSGWGVPGINLRGTGLTEKNIDREGGPYPPGVWRYQSYEFDVEYRINSHGFRERELTPKTAGQWRVGLLSDSFAAGHGVEENERFSDVWRDLIHPRLPSLDLWNLSAGGTNGTAQQADVLEGIGNQYQFDEIVVGFSSSTDLQDNRAWFIQKERPESERGGKKGRVPVRVWLRERSRLVTFLWVRSLRRFLKTSEPSDIHRESRVNELWPYTEKALDRMKAIAGARPLTIWYIPIATEWDDDMWYSMKKAHGYSDAGRWLTRDKVEQWAGANGVGFVDFCAFLAHRSAKELCYQVDFHWKSNAHRLVAESLSSDPNSIWRLSHP